MVESGCFRQQQQPQWSHARRVAWKVGAGAADALRSALVGDLHEEVPECIVEFLDMRQHSHAAASCGRALRRFHAVGSATVSLSRLDLI